MAGRSRPGRRGAILNSVRGGLKIGDLPRTPFFDSRSRSAGKCVAWRRVAQRLDLRLTLLLRVALHRGFMADASALLHGLRVRRLELIYEPVQVVKLLLELHRLFEHSPHNSFNRSGWYREGIDDVPVAGIPRRGITKNVILPGQPNPLNQGPQFLDFESPAKKLLLKSLVRQ